MSPEEIARDEWEKWLKQPYGGKSITQDALELCLRVAQRVAVEAAREERNWLGEEVCPKCKEQLARNDEYLSKVSG